MKATIGRRRFLSHAVATSTAAGGIAVAGVIVIPETDADAESPEA